MKLSTLFLEIVNEGDFDISIRDVKVNGKSKPQQADLGISYRGRIVSAGIESYPNIELHEV